MNGAEQLGLGRILVVDDEEFVRTAITTYLETSGYLVSAADDAESGLLVMAEADPPIEVVLVDLVMPRSGGLDFLRRVKSDVDPHAEVLIVTGCGEACSEAEARRLGVFDYITKPIVNFERDLISVVHSAIAQRRERLAMVGT